MSQNLNRREAASLLVGLLAGSALLADQGAAPPAQPKPNKWEETIAKFEARDRDKMPPKGAILFVGSSTIVGWPTAKSYPDLVTINRGFGGSQVRDSLYFADRIILPYEPKTIVFYAGDNDIASGRKPEQVRDDVAAVLAKVRGALPDTKFVYVAIKPSVARWKLYPAIKEANRLVREALASDPKAQFIDLDPMMINEQGEPRPELLKADGLHFNEEGYKQLTALVRPAIEPPKA